MNHFFSFIFLFVLASANVLSGMSEQDAAKQLKKIHSKLTLKYGSFAEEYPEQLMAVMFIKSGDRVLELGGNIGRNSCVMGTLLKKSRNLVVLECDPSTAQMLKVNRDLNHLSFHIEDSALSKVSLIQSGWSTVPSETVLPGYTKVKTISYQELKKKYGINFSVLVADCEGALYYILRDDESILSDINTIIVENDYPDRGHYEEVKNRFLAHGFKMIYSKDNPQAGGWPCALEFYQVWKKKQSPKKMIFK